MTLTGESLIFMAKLSESAEMYKEMFNYLKQFVESTEVDLSTEECKLFSSACRELTSPLRANVRVIESIQQKQHAEDNIYAAVLLNMQKQVKEEFRCTLNDMLDFISVALLKQWQDVETKAFFMKMRADLLKELYQVSLQEESQNIQEQCKDMYDATYSAAVAGLGKANALRVQIALNSALFYYDILNDKSKAIEINKTAFDDALQVFADIADNDEYRDSATALLLLRDFLNLWTSESEENI